VHQSSRVADAVIGIDDREIDRFEIGSEFIEMLAIGEAAGGQIGLDLVAEELTPERRP